MDVWIEPGLIKYSPLWYDDAYGVGTCNGWTRPGYRTCYNGAYIVPLLFHLAPPEYKINKTTRVKYCVSDMSSMFFCKYIVIFPLSFSPFLTRWVAILQLRLQHETVCNYKGRSLTIRWTHRNITYCGLTDALWCVTDFVWFLVKSFITLLYHTQIYDVIIYDVIIVNVWVVSLLMNNHWQPVCQWVSNTTMTFHCNGGKHFLLTQLK